MYDVFFKINFCKETTIRRVKMPIRMIEGMLKIFPNPYSKPPKRHGEFSEKLEYKRILKRIKEKSIMEENEIRK